MKKMIIITTFLSCSLLLAMGGPGKMGMEMGGGKIAAGMQHHKFNQRQNMFRFFDVNGDGKISRFEWEQRRQERMQERAQQGKPMKNAGKVRFEDIDLNRDGYIDRVEMKRYRQKRRKVQ